jgi:uncharacterized protein (TIGR00299 family) protein
VTTVAWWHCFSGIAGDMALGSLMDAGVELDQIERELAALPVGGWALEARPVLRAGLAATQVLVHVQETSVIRTHAHIVGLITEARLPPRARERALATFALLAEVEGRLHRWPPAQVHFHEVGGIDAIIDIVGTCVALELLGVDEIRASPVAQGTGVVRSAHGLLPNPSPAVVELLRDAPTYGTDNPAELTTPTGAALLAALGSGWGPMPAMQITRVGRGAGGRDPQGVPNLVQVVIGTRTDAAERGDGGQPLVLMESNVDDVTGETLADTVAALLGAGAADAWITPVVGKKGRPGHVISALGEPSAVAELRRVLMAETGTLGVRSQTLRRWAAARQIDEVEVDGYPVRVKRSPGRIKAEHDDAARVAARTGRPVREIARLAEEQAHRVHPSAGGGWGGSQGNIHGLDPPPDAAAAPNGGHPRPGAHQAGDDHAGDLPAGDLPDVLADAGVEGGGRERGGGDPQAGGAGPGDRGAGDPPAGDPRAGDPRAGHRFDADAGDPGSGDVDGDDPAGGGPSGIGSGTDSGYGGLHSVDPPSARAPGDDAPDAEETGVDSRDAGLHSVDPAGGDDREGA